MSTTVIETGSGGKRGGGDNTLLYVVIGGAVLVAIALGVVIALGYTVYKCDWGFGDDTECTDVPTGVPGQGGGTPEMWPGCSSGGGSADAAHGLPDGAPSDSPDSSAGYRQYDDSGTKLFWSEGCGWCDKPYEIGGKCYADAQGTGDPSQRRRVWDGGSSAWVWCDWDSDNAKWKGADACGRVPMDSTMSSARRVRRGKSPAQRKRRSGARKARVVRKKKASKAASKARPVRRATRKVRRQ